MASKKMKKSEPELKNYGVIFIVEKILEKRFKHGRPEYLVKWEGYSSSQNTWEPIEHFNPKLIENFEREIQKKNTPPTLPPSDSPKKLISETLEKNPNIGFDRGLEPEKIIGATNKKETSGGRLLFLMKWKNSNEADVVLAKTANEKCPDIVIKFYEEHLSWNDDIED